MSTTTTAAPEQQMHGTDLTVGSIPRHLIAFSIPLLLGSLMQTAYGLVNAIWVGRGLGTVALSAVTVSFPVLFLVIAIAGGITMATNILVSQAYGAKDMQWMRRSIDSGAVLTASLTLICVGAGLLVSKSLMHAMNTPKDVLPSALSYLRIFICGMPMMFGVFLIASILRGIGDSRTPLYFQSISVVVNAVLDPILMFGWLGCPRMGLNGTAVATIIAQIMTLTALVIYMRRRSHIVEPRWLHPDVDREACMLTIRIGVPSMVQQALVSVGLVVITSIVNKFGEQASAGFGAGMRIDQIAFMPLMSFGMAVSTLTGQNIGAGHFDRVRKIFSWGVLLSCGVTLFPSLLAILAPKLLLSMFTTDRMVLETGAGYLRVMGFGYLLLSVMFIGNGIVNGSGHTMVPTFISLIALWAFRVPLAEYLSSHMKRPEGIWYAILISNTVGMALSLGYYYSGRWKRPVRNEKGARRGRHRMLGATMTRSRFRVLPLGCLIVVVILLIGLASLLYHHVMCDRMIVAVDRGNLAAVKRVSALDPFAVNAESLKFDFSTYREPVLNIALKSRYRAIARFLIQSGANSNSWSRGLTNEDGASLHFAAAWGDVELVRMLLRKGAKINCRNMIGETPLHLAAQVGHTQVVNELLQTGADPNIENDYKETPLDYAIAGGNGDVAKLIKAYGGKAHVGKELGS
jgi:putative MATE family efflux protein